MSSPIDQLKERVFGNKSKYKGTKLTDILCMVREFSCLGEIIGKDFEVLDSKGKIVYTIRQKPMAICQLKTLLKEFCVIKQIDAEIEAKKFGTESKSNGRLKK